ncbi:MAG: hypothetical protein ACOYIK_08200 [Coriobacteriales bacterium]
MSNRKTKVNRKYLREAVELRDKRNNYRMMFFIGLAIAVVLWAIYSFSPVNTSLPATIITAVIAVVVACVVGGTGTIFSRTSKEYKKYMSMHGLDDETVKEFDRTGK